MDNQKTIKVRGSAIITADNEMFSIPYRKLEAGEKPQKAIAACKIGSLIETKTATSSAALSQNHVAAVSHPGIHQTDIETIKCYKAAHMPQYMPHSGISAGVRPLRGRIADGTLSEGSRWSPSVMLVGLLRRPQERAKTLN